MAADCAYYHVLIVYDGSMNRNLVMHPVPPSVRDQMEHDIHDVPLEHRFDVRLAIRRAYAAGYDDGHRDGYQEAQADAFAKQEQAKQVEA